MRYAKAGTDKRAYICQAIRIIETRYAEQITVAIRAYFNAFYCAPNSAACSIGGGYMCDNIAGKKYHTVARLQRKVFSVYSNLDAVGIDSKNPYAPRKAVPKIVELINRIIELNADTDAGLCVYP